MVRRLTNVARVLSRRLFLSTPATTTTTGAAVAVIATATSTVGGLLVVGILSSSRLSFQLPFAMVRASSLIWFVSPRTCRSHTLFKAQLAVNGFPPIDPDSQ